MDEQTDKPFGPSPGPKGAGNFFFFFFAIAHPIHVGNSHTKFGLISSNGLGGESMTVGRTEAIAIPPLLFFKKSVEIISSVKL